TLLAQLLANATEGLAESESISEQNYLLGENGEYLIDPASPEQHAALVLAHIRSTRVSRAPYESMDFIETTEWMPESPEYGESADTSESEGSFESVEFY